MCGMLTVALLDGQDADGRVDVVVHVIAQEVWPVGVHRVRKMCFQERGGALSSGEKKCFEFRRVQERKCAYSSEKFRREDAF
jgi:hypothetical protein